MKISYRDAELLKEIRECCFRISKTLERIQHDREIFINDNDYFDSVTLKIQLIGEYAKRLSKEYIDETSEIMNWKSIKGMRDIVAHNYNSLDPEAVWDTAVYNIPSLSAFIDDQLNKSE